MTSIASRNKFKILSNKKETNKNFTEEVTRMTDKYMKNAEIP